MTIVIPRSVWRPRYANGFEIIGTQEWLNAGKEIWLHHSVTNPPGPDATLEQDCAHMRDFEAIGQSRFGGGISYTWVTMPSGRVFQGHDIDRQGAHTYGRNNRSRAICLAGRYDTNPLPDRMANSVAALLRELGATIDGPHSAVYATDCPGQNARNRISYMNELAASGRPIETGADDMSEADAWNGFAGAMMAAKASADAGTPDPVAQAFQALAWNGFAGALKAAGESAEAGAPDDIAKALRRVVGSVSGPSEPLDYDKLARSILRIAGSEA